MITCIFNQLCSGKNIKQDNNIIIIPLFNFDTFIDNKGIVYNHQDHKPTIFDNNLPEKYKYNGLPAILLIYHYIQICIEMTDQYIKTLKFSIICNGNNYNVDHIKYHLKYNVIGYDLKPYISFLLMENNIIREKINTKHKLDLNYITKAILIYFSPLSYQSNDQIPIIEKIILSSKEIDLLYFEANDLLDIEIFGIKIYVLPLSKEFSDWEHIRETLDSTGNVLKKLSSSGINFSVINDLYLNIFFYNDLESNNYITNICGINLNILRIGRGMCGKSYSCEYDNIYNNKQSII